MKRARISKAFGVFLPLLFSTGCAVLDRADRFGASWDIGVGGLLSYVADAHFKGHVGFSQTHFEDASNAEKTSPPPDFLGIRGFL